MQVVICEAIYEVMVVKDNVALMTILTLHISKMDTRPEWHIELEQCIIST